MPTHLRVEQLADEEAVGEGSGHHREARSDQRDDGRSEPVEHREHRVDYGQTGEAVAAESLSSSL